MGWRIRRTKGAGIETAQGRSGGFLAASALLMAACAGLAQENIGQIPAAEERSKDYTVQVEGVDIPMHAVKVAPADPILRWKAMDNKVNSAQYSV